MIKTNKSYSKRIKITRKGKLVARKPGQNHFNARERSRASLSKRRTQALFMDNKVKSRFFATV